MDVNVWKSIYENGVQEKTNSSSSDSQICSSSSPPGPDPAKLKAILDRTNYSHQVTAGQRKYGGPPPEWNDSPPPTGCEVFVGRVPKDVYEDELIPLFERIGKLWDLRLMIDPVSSHSRGYAFITYCNKEDAQTAVQELNGCKIRSKDYSIKVNISVPNLRLFIGNIPKIMSKEQIYSEFNKVTEGLAEVIIYSSPDDRKKNRGFCFLEFDSHKNASAAKRKLTTAGMKIFKSDILVDWADPQEEPDEETMSKVKVLYVRNLTNDVTENQLKELFEVHGVIERVKKIKDYAFIHFEEREQALEAMENLNDKEFCGSNIQISLAKPPSDRRKKEEVLRNRERRMIMMMQQKQIMMAYPRVPPSQLRPPIPSIPPLPGPPVPIPPMNHRNNRNRFAQPFNPMLPAPFSRQNPPWNPLMFYDPSEWWYGGAAAAAAAVSSTGRGGGAPPPPQFLPSNAQWNYGLANGGQMPPMPYCANGAGGGQPNPGTVSNMNRRNGPNSNPNQQMNVFNSATTGIGGIGLNNNQSKKWRNNPKTNQNGSLNMSVSGSNVGNPNLSNKRQ